MTEEPQKSLRDTVLRAIREKKVSMRPRWHFVLRTVLFAALGLLILSSLFYLVSFIVFGLRHSGALFATAFGAPGWRLFFESLPWVLVLLAVIFVVILQSILRKYPIGYQRPIFYLVLFILLITVVGGSLLALAPFHSRLFHAAHENHLPIAGPFYRQYGEHHPPDLHRGTITATTTTGFMLHELGEEDDMVVITPATRLPSGADFKAGDRVVVIGPELQNVVQAMGVDLILNDPE